MNRVVLAGLLISVLGSSPVSTFAQEGSNTTVLGSVTLTRKVLADGQPLLSRRMRSGDSPYEIQLPITGREQITLLVEPGEGLDLADHADWCDARFIKNRP
jgi:hypothetical protein